MIELLSERKRVVSSVAFQIRNAQSHYFTEFTLQLLLLGYYLHYFTLLTSVKKKMFSLTDCTLYCAVQWPIYQSQTTLVMFLLSIDGSASPQVCLKLTHQTAPTPPFFYFTLWSVENSVFSNI